MDLLANACAALFIECLIHGLVIVIYINHITRLKKLVNPLAGKNFLVKAKSLLEGAPHLINISYERC
jgi:hypothetical protein